MYSTEVQGQDYSPPMRAPISNGNNTTLAPRPRIPRLSSPRKAQLARIITIHRIRYISYDKLMRTHGCYGELFGRCQGYGFHSLDIIPVVEDCRGVRTIVDVDVE